MTFNANCIKNLSELHIKLANLHKNRIVIINDKIKVQRTG